MPSGLTMYQCGSGSSPSKCAKTICPVRSQAIAPSAPGQLVSRRRPVPSSVHEVELSFFELPGVVDELLSVG